MASLPYFPLLQRKVVKPRQVLPRLMICSVSGNAVHDRRSVITIPTQVTLGLLQGAVGSGMRKVSGEETHHGVPLCYSSCDRAKLALRRTHNHSDMWELS